MTLRSWIGSIVVSCIVLRLPFVVLFGVIASFVGIAMQHRPLALKCPGRSLSRRFAIVEQLGQVDPLHLWVSTAKSAKERFIHELPAGNRLACHTLKLEKEKEGIAAAGHTHIRRVVPPCLLKSTLSAERNEFMQVYHVQDGPLSRMIKERRNEGSALRDR